MSCTKLADMRRRGDQMNRAQDGDSMIKGKTFDGGELRQHRGNACEESRMTDDRKEEKKTSDDLSYNDHRGMQQS